MKRSFHEPPERSDAPDLPFGGCDYFGTAIPLAIAKRYAAALRTSRFIRALAREITGAHLRAALDSIDRLDRFEAS